MSFTTCLAGKDNCIYMHEGRSFALQFVLYNVTFIVIISSVSVEDKKKFRNFKQSYGKRGGGVYFIFLHKYAVFVISLKIDIFQFVFL